MASLKLNDKNLDPIQKFEIRCNVCGSFNCLVDMHLTSFPEFSRHDISIICKDCKTEEVCHASEL
jgi:C4-type Zn-finger protein